MEHRNLSTISINKHIYILCNSHSRYGTEHVEANFRATGKALCGILKPGQTLSEWIDETKTRRKYKQELEEEIKELRENK